MQDTLTAFQSIVYKVTAYNQSQLVIETIKTVVRCYSIYTHVYLDIWLMLTILLNTADTIICLGSGTTLTSNIDYILHLQVFSIGEEITAFPEYRTVYMLHASNELNSISQEYVTIHVEDFQLQLSYQPMPAEEGNPLQSLPLQRFTTPF